MYCPGCVVIYFATMQKHQEDVTLIDDELKIGDEMVTTDAALMASQQVADRQRELSHELRKKAAVARQNAAAADRQSEKAEDGQADKAEKGENDTPADNKGQAVSAGKGADVPGSKGASEIAQEETPAPARGATIVDLNA